jgi:hypothetical protein
MFALEDETVLFLYCWTFRAYEVLEPILTDAMRWSGHAREELARTS